MSDPARAAAEFTRLVEVVATLCGPEGCPWDREQTIDTLKPFVLEETYEVLEAIDRHDHAALCEELGDFVFEAVFVAELESAAGRFTIADSLRSIADKLVRRHPHVFKRHEGEAALESAGQVRARWEEIKAAEKAATGRGTPQATLLAGLSPVLPALLRAYHIGVRAKSVGFDWARPSDVITKIEEEVDELRDVIERAGPTDQARVEEEMGDLLFSLVQWARQIGVEPETALRKANDKFTQRFGAMERAIGASGRTMSGMNLDELEAEWQRAKKASRSTEG